MMTTIPKKSLYSILQRKLTHYQAQERDARQRQRATKDHSTRLTFREQELIAHGKTLAATEIMEEIAEYARQIGQ